jgi:4'-phosphopantetheinyl transferase
MASRHDLVTGAMSSSTSEIGRIGCTNDGVKPCHVDVWFLDLDAPSSDLSLSLDVLSADERQRAATFRAERTGRRFAACRAGVRRILASQVSQDPAMIRFRYGRHGRPELADNPSDLRFSVSHSSGHAVVAVTHRCDLGIDIEVSRRIDHLDSLAQRYLAPMEIEQLARADDQVRGFWKVWTRKEAYVKALGTGLTGPIREFAVSLSEPARLLTTGEPGDDSAQWTLLDLSYDALVVSLAVRARSVFVDTRTPFDD